MSEEKCKAILKEYQAKGEYQEQVYQRMRSSYRDHYRRMVPLLVNMLDIRSNNTTHRPVIEALTLVKRYAGTSGIYYPAEETVPLAGVLRPMWRDLVQEKDKDGELRVNRVNYELCVLDALQEKLRCRELWVVGANKYRNPDDDLPKDFEEKRSLKNIYAQRLARLETGKPDTYPNLQKILSQPINWDLIEEQYDQMIKYATALRLGTAETEAVLRRFNRTELQHPTYRAFAEPGRAVKTIFLCRYLQSEALRREIHKGLNVIENWNGANGFIFYGHSGDFATNRLDEQEVAALCLHLLQICLVYVNTLLIQRVLAEPQQFQQMNKEDFRALTPLIYGHVTPYGVFRLDLSERMQIEENLSA